MSEVISEARQQRQAVAYIQQQDHHIMAPITLESRIRGALYGLAVVDALGAPCEFQDRGTFPHTTEMRANLNFRLGPGYWTDDTSQALCLAESLIKAGGKTDVIDQVQRYNSWFVDGHLSSTGKCFDIGNATRAALPKWSVHLKKHKLSPTIPKASTKPSVLSSDQRAEVAIEGLAMAATHFGHEKSCGNGSLMRVLPCSLITPDFAQALKLAHESSLTTHPHPRCAEACTIYTTLICTILSPYLNSPDNPINKPQLALKGVRPNIDYSSDGSLDTPGPVDQQPDFQDPDIRTRFARYLSIHNWRSTQSKRISSSGYVLNTLEAALWCFFSTNTFEKGAIKVVNLGDDADTVGAVYGGIAGAWYGYEAIPERWLEDLRAKKMIEDTLEGILKVRESLTTE